MNLKLRISFCSVFLLCVLVGTESKSVDTAKQPKQAVQSQEAKNVQVKAQMAAEPTNKLFQGLQQLNSHVEDHSQFTHEQKVDMIHGHIANMRNFQDRIDKALAENGMSTVNEQATEWRYREPISGNFVGSLILVSTDVVGNFLHTLVDDAVMFADGFNPGLGSNGTAAERRKNATDQIKLNLKKDGIRAGIDLVIGLLQSTTSLIHNNAISGSLDFVFKLLHDNEDELLSILVPKPNGTEPPPVTFAPETTTLVMETTTTVVPGAEGTAAAITTTVAAASDVTTTVAAAAAGDVTTVAPAVITTTAAAAEETKPTEGGVGGILGNLFGKK